MNEQFVITEYEALRAEERDRINARLQVWVILVSLASIFSVVSVQSGMIAYITALFPFLACCLALHVRHSEGALRQIRRYLYLKEKETGYQGYEHYNRSTPRTTHGGYLDALRYALMVTQLLALTVVAIHLVADHALLLIILLIIGIEAIVMFFTWRWLKK
jgi:hypothetical protein